MSVGAGVIAKLLQYEDKEKLAQRNARHREAGMMTNEITFGTHLLALNSKHDEASILLRSFVPMQFRLSESPVRRCPRSYLDEFRAWRMSPYLGIGQNEKKTRCGARLR